MIGKITGIFKRKNPAAVETPKTNYGPVKEKTPLSMKVIDPAVGAGSRVLALLGDISLTQACYMIIGQDPMLIDFSKEAFAFLVEQATPYLPSEPWITTLFSDIEKFFPFIALFFGLRFVSVLLTGVSPAQFLMGLKGHSNVLWARFGGVIRTVFEILTMPLIIFDLSALFSKRTLKEVLSFTTITPRNKLLRFIGTVIFIPAVFLFTAIAPMFNQLPYLETGVPYSELSVIVKKSKRKNKKTEAEIAAAETTKPKEFVIQSDMFRFNSTMANKPELMLIPDWVTDVVKERNNKKMVIPVIKIAHTGMKAQGELRVMKLFNLNEFLNVFEEGNPLAFFFFPNLTKWNSNQDVPTLKHNKTAGVFTINQTAELEMILDHSLKLNINNVQDYVLEHGPLIKGMVDLRGTLAELIETESISEAQNVKTVKNSVLILKGDVSNVDYIIPLTFSYGIIYAVTWKGGQSEALAKEFYGEFFANIEGRERSPEVNFFADDGTNFSYQSPFAILDLFFSKKIKTKEREILYQYFYNYFYELGGKALRSEEKGAAETVGKALKHFTDMIALQPATEDTFLQDKLKTDIGTLIASLQTNDTSYFGVEAKVNPDVQPETPVPVSVTPTADQPAKSEEKTVPKNEGVAKP